MLIIISILCLLLQIIKGTQPEDPINCSIERKILPSEQRLISELSIAPFDEVIAHKARFGDDLYAYILNNRPEIQSIQWKEEDIEKLSEDIVALAKTEADPPWRNKFTASIRSIMRMREIDPDKIGKVQKCCAELVMKRRRKEWKERKRIGGQSEEQKKKDNANNAKQKLIRKMEHEKGRGLPLLHYINLRFFEEGGQKLTPQMWHKEALKFQDKYRSFRSFSQALTIMFDTLGYPRAQTYDLRTDPRNAQCDSWKKPGQEKKDGDVDKELKLDDDRDQFQPMVEHQMMVPENQNPTICNANDDHWSQPQLEKGDDVFHWIDVAPNETSQDNNTVSSLDQSLFGSSENEDFLMAMISQRPTHQDNLEHMYVPQWEPYSS